MGLETNAIDTYTIRLDELNNSASTGGLVLIIFEVIVVIVELGLGCDTSSNTECDRQISLTNGLVPDRFSVCTILVES